MTDEFHSDERCSFQTSGYTNRTFCETWFVCTFTVSSLQMVDSRIVRQHDPLAVEIIPKKAQLEYNKNDFWRLLSCPVSSKDGSYLRVELHNWVELWQGFRPFSALMLDFHIIFFSCPLIKNGIDTVLSKIGPKTYARCTNNPSNGSLTHKTHQESSLVSST